MVESLLEGRTSLVNRETPPIALLLETAAETNWAGRAQA